MGGGRLSKRQKRNEAVAEARRRGEVVDGEEETVRGRTRFQVARLRGELTVEEQDEDRGRARERMARLWGERTAAEQEMARADDREGRARRWREQRGNIKREFTLEHDELVDDLERHEHDCYFRDMEEDVFKGRNTLLFLINSTTEFERFLASEISFVVLSPWR